MLKYYIKLILITLAVLALVCLIAVVSIVTFVSPNRLKPLLAAQIMKSTGQQLIIDGDLSWTFFPSFGVKAGHMTLTTPNGFSEARLMEVQSATVEVNLLPLLRNKIQSNAIILHGLQLFVIKNAKGELNWHFPSTNQVPIPSTSNKVMPAAMGLMISHLEVTDGQLMWMDEQSKQSFQLKNFSFKANDISIFRPFPIELTFELTNAVSSLGHFKINGNIAMNTIKKIISLRSLTLWAQLQEKTVWVIKGDLLADFSNDTPTKNSFRLQGQFDIDDLKLNHLNLTQVHIPVLLENNLLTLSPLTAHLYQGTLKTNTTVQLGDNVPHFATQIQLTHIQLGPLLRDLGKSKLIVNGIGAMDIQATTTGADSATIINNINGNAHFSISNGVLEGIDISYYINAANALLERRSFTQTNTNKTAFDQLTGSAILKEGIIENNDFLLEASSFTTKGKGTIHLVNENIDYLTETTINDVNSPTWINIAKVSIPISIKGPLSAPAIRFEANLFAESVSQNVIQKSTDVLKNKIKTQGNALLQNFLNH